MYWIYKARGEGGGLNVRPQVWTVESGYLYNTLHQLFAVHFKTVQTYKPNHPTLKVT